MFTRMTEEYKDETKSNFAALSTHVPEKSNVHCIEGFGIILRSLEPDLRKIRGKAPQICCQISLLRQSCSQWGLHDNMVYDYSVVSSTENAMLGITRFAMIM